MQLWNNSTCPITGSQTEELSTSLSISSSQKTVESNVISSQPPFLQITQTQSPQPLLMEHSFQPFHHFYCPPLDALEYLPSLLNCEARNCTQGCRWDCTNIECNRTIPSFDWLLVLCLLHPVMHFALLVPRAHCWLLLILPSPAPPDPFL